MCEWYVLLSLLCDNKKEYAKYKNRQKYVRIVYSNKFVLMIVCDVILMDFVLMRVCVFGLQNPNLKTTGVFFFVAKNKGGGGIQVYVWKETDSNDDIVRYGMDGDDDGNCRQQ